MVNYALRDYQVSGKSIVYRLIREGKKRVIYWAPTGTGKGLAMSDMANDVIKAGKKCLVIMRRREVVFQTQKNFAKYHGHNSSIIMGSEKGFSPDLPLQICSIDTLRSRDNAFLQSFDVVIIDECHDTNSATYQDMLNFLGDKIFIGFTATPFTVGGKPLLFWECVAQPITADEAREKGMLVDDISFVPAEQIDTKDLKLNAGEYSAADLFLRAKDNVIIGDIVASWKKRAEGRPTLMFCVNKEHSMLMTAAFNLAQVDCLHVDDSTTSTERQQAFEMLKSGKIKILSSIGILSTGVDLPFVSCIVAARPTYSEVLWVQMIGRGLRPYKVCGSCNFEFGGEKECLRCKSTLYTTNKTDCMILDHAGNTIRHGLPYSARVAKLAGLGYEAPKTKNGEAPNVPIKQCDNCFLVYRPSLAACPSCGTINAVKNAVKEKGGELRLIDDATMRKLQLNKCISALNGLKLQEKFYNWKPNAKYFKLHKTQGDIIFKFEKELELPSWLKKIILQNHVAATTK